MTSQATRAGARRAVIRCLVHLGLIVTVVVSLVSERRQAQHRRDHVRVLRHHGRTRPGGGRQARRACPRDNSPTGFYIRGKVIEADYGMAHAKVFIGSENFSNTSLNDNREPGLIISSHAVMSAIAGTFASDFPNGQHWS
jgi:phosphatidylserine/phosphatidylglycerophosphate/cardiolipin synthase-like enzyme